MSGLSSSFQRRLQGCVLVLCVAVAGVSLPPAAAAAAADTADPFAHPAELEPDVRFWIHVYTEADTTADCCMIPGISA